MDLSSALRELREFPVAFLRDDAFLVFALFLEIFHRFVCYDLSH